MQFACFMNFSMWSLIIKLERPYVQTIWKLFLQMLVVLQGLAIVDKRGYGHNAAEVIWFR